MHNWLRPVASGIIHWMFNILNRIIRNRKENFNETQKEQAVLGTDFLENSD